MKRTKKIPIKNVPVGEKFSVLITGGTTRYARRELIEKNGAFFVTKLFDDKIEKPWPTEEAYIEVELSEREKYFMLKDKIKEVQSRLNSPLSWGHFGEHTMDNSCFSYDIIEFVMNLEESKLEFLGYSEAPYEKVCGPAIFDMALGVCDKRTGERNWFHVDMEVIESLRKVVNEEVLV